MGQLPMFAPDAPTGVWADLGRWMVGEGEYPAAAVQEAAQGANGGRGEVSVGYGVEAACGGGGDPQ